MTLPELDWELDGISVFAIFSYGISVLGTPQSPPHDCVFTTQKYNKL